ncbi:FAD-binding oxidoreductase [Azospirillum sp. A26]|uniref:FAD-binding oxidoreductase n=1 Tax=Azospirillum sp. A26 TaxID=3160607 RepID=UPI00366FA03B
MTRCLSFRGKLSAQFRYRPGQFLTLELPVPGGPVWRTYTISSSPSRPMGVSLTVKAQAGSVGTRWMLDTLRPGMRLRAKGPAGSFALLPDARDKYLFLSAGSGVTPSVSMTTYLFDRGTGIDVVLVTCAKRPAELVCRRTLELMASRVPSIKLHFIVEQDDPFDVWTGYRGRLNQVMLGAIAPDYLDRHVYCCGPEPFMKGVRDMLIALGFDMSRYFQESFNAPVLDTDEAPATGDFVPDPSHAAEVVFSASGVTAGCDESDTILHVAKNAGLNIPSGCTFGVCGTCSAEAVRRGPHGPQRRHFRRGHRRRLHPRLLFPPDRKRQPRHLTDCSPVGIPGDR